MIQLSGKYGVFVTMGNSNALSIYCLEGTVANCKSFVMSKKQLYCSSVQVWGSPQQSILAGPLYYLVVALGDDGAKAGE
jgi:hypothetical protein